MNLPGAEALRVLQTSTLACESVIRQRYLYHLKAFLYRLLTNYKMKNQSRDMEETWQIPQVMPMNTVSRSATRAPTSSESLTAISQLRNNERHLWVCSPDDLGPLLVWMS